MKEIVYLDTQMVNSVLAQLDQGLLLKNAVDTASTQTNSEEGGGVTTTEGNGGINFGISGAVKVSKSDIDKFNIVYSTTNRELIETAMDDYSLDLLLEKLQDNFAESIDVKEGSYIKITDTTHFYDFKQLSKSLNKEYLKIFLDEVFEQYEQLNREIKAISKASKAKNQNRLQEIEENLKNSPVKIMENLQGVSEYMTTLLDDSVLIRIGETLSLCDAKNIRPTNALFGFMNLSKRKATIIGTVVAQEDGKNILEDIEKIDSANVIKYVSGNLMQLVLTSFGVARVGDYYVRPMAIYFE